MRKLVAILLVGFIAAIALHDYYMKQYDLSHEVKKELHCNHLHHSDFHIVALMPQQPSSFNSSETEPEFPSITLHLQGYFFINSPPPKP